MHTLLYDLCDHLTAQLRGAEILNCSLDGETSEFVRLNHGAVRQAGSVKQAYLDITLVDGTMTVEDSAVRVDGDVPFAAAMFKGQIASAIEGQLQRLLR